MAHLDRRLRFFLANILLLVATAAPSFAQRSSGISPADLEKMIGNQEVRLEPHEIARFQPLGWDSQIDSASISPSGDRLVVTSNLFSTEVAVVDLETGEAIISLEGHEDDVSFADFSPDGKRIVTASDDKTARVWDAATGKQTLNLAGHSARVRYATYSADGRKIATTSDDGTIKVWDARSGEETLTIETSATRATNVSFSPDGKRILAPVSKTFVIWDAATGSKIVTSPEHIDYLRRAKYSPNGDLIVAVVGRNLATIRDAVSLEEKSTLFGRGGRWGVGLSIDFSPDGTKIVTGGENAKAIIWDTATGLALTTRELTKYSSDTSTALFTPAGDRIVTTNRSGYVQVWDVVERGEHRILAWHFGRVLAAAFSPSGEFIITGGQDGNTVVWDVHAGAPINSFFHRAPIYSIDVSPDGETFIVGYNTLEEGILSDTVVGFAEIRNFKTGEIIHKSDKLNIVKDVKYSPDGSRFLVTSGSRVLVYNTQGRNLLLILSAHNGDVRSVNFSPDGSKIATASEDRTARLWDAYTGEELRVLFQHKTWVTGASFSADGDYVLVTTTQGSNVVDAETARPVLSINGYRGGGWESDYSANGEWILTAGPGAASFLSDAGTGDAIQLLSGHAKNANGGVFSDDGRYVATTGDDSTVRIWKNRAHPANQTDAAPNAMD